MDWSAVWAFAAPYVSTVLAAVVPALAALVVAWVREATLRAKARQAAVQVELEASLDPELRGERKLARARELLSDHLLPGDVDHRLEREARSLAGAKLEDLSAELTKRAGPEAVSGVVNRAPPRKMEGSPMGGNAATTETEK